VLRAQVKLADDSAAWRIAGLIAPGTPGQPPLRLPATPGETAREGGRLALALAPGRYLLLDAATADGPAGCSAGSYEDWQRLAIAAGEPQVYAATSEQFVAQMLNLDAVGAIAFDKGCYTGQEVIARAHYRGRVKRRLQRFVTASTLAAGAGGSFADGRSFKVVDAVRRADGRCEFLAVAPLTGADGDAAPEAAAHVEAQPLPLPYALPD
jgi:tRNA-modifying protein YgfZ